MERRQKDPKRKVDNPEPPIPRRSGAERCTEDSGREISSLETQALFAFCPHYSLCTPGGLLSILMVCLPPQKLTTVLTSQDSWGNKMRQSTQSAQRPLIHRKHSINIS